jgi:hypothetical protein
MTRIMLILVVAAAVGVAALAAQTVPPAGGQTAGTSAAPAASAPPALPPNQMDAQLRSQWATSRSLLTRLAAKMPDEGYAFQPTPDVRTFGASLVHAAAYAYGLCGTLSGQRRSIDGARLAEVHTTKAQVTAFLDEALTFCNDFVSTVQLSTLLETYDSTFVRPDGTRTPLKSARGGLLSLLIAHNNEMYGYLSMYLRLKGVVPPSSEPRTPGRGRGVRP